MISVTRYRGAQSTFETRARDALGVLAQRPGFVRGTLARSTDDVADWVLVTEWRDVGSYRRALGNYAVKLAATGLLGEAVNEPTSFETLVEARPGEALAMYGSDREATPSNVDREATGE
jgi:hypothetical protein